MSNVKIEDGSWWYYGNGAEGTRWYRMGPDNEMTVNCFGYETGCTVAEAIKKGILTVDEKTGTPVVNAG